MARTTHGKTAADGAAKAARAEAVVVLSGGQDSAICAALAARRHGPDAVAAITFRYGQRHAAEIKYARGVVRRFGLAAHKILPLSFYPQLTDNSLFDPSAPIVKAPGASCPDTFVEGRNAFFLLAAGVYAKSLGARKIYIGVSQADYSGYPDCRTPFVAAQQRAMRLAMEWPFEIIAPLMDMTKADEWALADKLGIFDFVRTRTLTCYRGLPGDGCGRCPACKLRAAGLAEYLKRKSAISKGKMQ